MPDALLIAKTVDKSLTDISLLPGKANRHGLISGASGAGKTVAWQVMAEHFSAIGVRGIQGGRQGLFVAYRDR